jgi:hypothetical protein
MTSKSLKGDWSTFTRIAVHELNATKAELEAEGVVLVGVGPGRQQAAARLEKRRCELKQSIPKFFKAINTRVAAENRLQKMSAAV